LVGLVPEGNVEHGNIELLIELAQGGSGGVVQVSDLGAETVPVLRRRRAEVGPRKVLRSITAVQ
jgi:hypothetical protein